jgi:hypothetical protein
MPPPASLPFHNKLADSALELRPHQRFGEVLKTKANDSLSSVDNR